MSEFTILVKQQEDTAIARIIGKGSFKNARLLKSYVDQVRLDGCKKITLDLQECLHMDSTFMGVIAGIAVGQKRNSNPPPNIINANPRALELLNSLGLGQILNIDLEPNSSPSTPQTFTQLPTSEPDNKAEITRTMLDAHQTLVNVDQNNAAKFQDVITFLKNKLGSNSQ